MNLSTPPNYNTLGQLRKVVTDETDGEINSDTINRWINLEIFSISAKREWSFFLQTGTANIGIMNTTTNISVLPLPTYMSKLFRIYMMPSILNIGASSGAQIEFKQGTNYELYYDSTTKIWNAWFRNLGNTTTLEVWLEYYLDPTKLVANADAAVIPERFANVVILGVTARAKQYLMDMSESVLDRNRQKELLQEMVDFDARQPDLPQQMSPNKGQSRDDYAHYLNGQRTGDYSSAMGSNQTMFME